MLVYEALRRSLALESKNSLSPEYRVFKQDSLISLLIHDIFGGEILKTHMKKKWHFYNRIDGERIDFTEPKTHGLIKMLKFEDIPSTPDETHDYVDQADYSTFFMQFVSTFEETIGLEKYQTGLIA